MLSLKDGQKTSSELERLLGTRASTILHSIKDMIELGLVNRTASGYMLSNVGQVQAQVLDDLVGCIVALDEHKEFWTTHDISGIPVRLQKKIGMLSQSETIEADPGALLKTVQHFINELNRSQEICGVSPIIVPGYSEVIASAIARGARVNLVVTEAIFKIMHVEYYDVLKALLQHENFKLYLIDDNIRVAFTVTESFLNLGLFRLDGGYDLGTDLICIGESATAWGNELFEYYRGISRQVTDI